MTEAFLVIFLICVAPVGCIPQLLFANRQDIRLVDANRSIGNDTTVVDNLEDAAAVDYIFHDGTIFWSDVTLEMIKSRNITDKHSRTVDVITIGLVSPDGLACDWLGNKLYWTDSETDRIEVSNLDGSYRKVLFWSDLDQPRAIALDPRHGYMYWTDWGEQPKIERAGMDGSSEFRSVIVDTDIVWPNGLTIDYQDDKIYWADARRSFIHSCNLDGTNRTSVIDGALPHPFALTLFQDSLYWTDWQSQAIHTCNKRSGEGRRDVHTNIFSPMDIHAYHASRQPPGINPCGDDNGGCSHLCLMSPRPSSFTCACPTGVRMTDDQKTCTDGISELLLLARRPDIRLISLDMPDYTDVVLQLNNILHAVAIDYDPVEGMLYWTDDQVQAISRASLDGTGQESIVTTEVKHPDGIAVDWIARNLYWTDTGRDLIEVARLNGTSRTVIVSEDLDEPRAIAVDPIAGLLYWTDWGDPPKIDRANLDGSNRTVIVNTYLGWPNGLALDHTEQKIYWGDAKMDRIEVANTDGSDRRVLVTGESDIPHIFGFSLLGEYIYWTDWQRRSIERINKRDGSGRQIIIEQLPDLMGLKAVAVKKAEGTNPCAVNNGNCSHLCLYRPQGLVCVCPMGLELLNDGVTCIVPEAFLLFSHRTDIRRISLETSHNEVIIPLSDVKDASELDYDINDQRIYWTDSSLKSISRAFMNGTKHEKVIRFGLDYPEGMAVDWVAHNLYWADFGTRRIEMSRMNGTSRRVLIWKSLEPRTIALDPPRGYMYWCNWMEPSRIERAALDGTQRRVLVPGGGRMYGLTIDFTASRLYWINFDITNLIEWTDLDGRNRNQVMSDLPSPFGLTQYEDFIFWTDWSTKSIEKANKSTGLNRSRIQGHLDTIMDISVFHTSRQSGWNNCNKNNGGCSHLCISHSDDYPSNLTHHCECPTHYTIAPDNTSCTAPQSFILFSQKSSISRMVPDGQTTPSVVLPILGLRSIKSIAYDPIDEYIYWIEGKTKMIKRSRGDGSETRTFIPQDHLMQPYAIAIDPFTRHLYWSDQAQNVINVTKLDGTPVGVIISSASKQQNQQKPRSIALAPRHGLIFWVNMLNPAKIERADLDGVEKVSLFSQGLGNPTALTADESTLKIFWADSLKRVTSADFDGSNRQVLLHTQVSEVVGLAVSGPFLFIADRDYELVQFCDKDTGANVVKEYRRLSQLTGLISVTALNADEVARMPCGVDNGGCTHFCVHERSEGRMCSCPIGLQLDRDQRTCSEPPSCEETEFMCRTGSTPCIPANWRCDGTPECEDGSDEHGCSSCVSGQFQCGSGECISKNLKCDGKASCEDGSDEEDCKPCSGDYYWCESQLTCLSRQVKCSDGDECWEGGDCEGGTNDQVMLRADSVTTQYTISIVVGVLFVFGVLFIVVFARHKRSQNNTAVESNMVLMMTTEDKNKVVEIPTPPNTMTSSNSASMLGRKLTSSSGSGPPYDRNHVTGASSSSSTLTHYPKETLNPPPSPITDRSICGESGEDVFFTPVSGGGAKKLAPPPTRHGHRHHKRRHIPPLPTPASTTDMCEESEPLFCHSRHQSAGHFYRISYDSDPFYPPPPTPLSQYLSDAISECPPSTSTERSFFNPYPPPPSPAANNSDY